MDHEEQPSAGSPGSPGEAPASPIVPSFRAQNDSLLHRVLFNEREIRSGWRLLIFVVLWVGIFFAAASLTRWFSLSTRQITAGTILRSEGLMFFAALVSAAILGLAEKRSFANYALPWSRAFQGKFWRGVLWGGVALTALLLLIRLGGGFSFGALSTAGRWQLLRDGGLWAAASLLIGFFEEFFFRGYALFTLTTGIGFWPSAIVLSIVFGAAHLGNHGEDWPGVLAVMLIGLFFCFTVRRTGTLWFAIGLHAMWDYGENFIFAVPDSGVVTGHHLFTSSLHGPHWLTGGSAGPEGSLFVFVVIGVLFLLFHLIYPKARFGVMAAHKPQPAVAEGVAGAGAA
ncbi:MAG: CPBP family intramembrane metalloprotease [Acidobacteriota bacterium]|nr:CPBP family intramembrane metalloprotease [Acidobacteriota bacterium]